MFDPTWFRGGVDLSERLRAQREVKTGRKLAQATAAYLAFLAEGGEIRQPEPTPALLLRYLRRGVPLLTGLSATWLYRSAREREEGTRMVYDDVRGEPAGHFVVVHGYDPAPRTVRVADPFPANPYASATGPHHYQVEMNRLLGAIFLGVVTYDANLLVVRPRSPS
jgi:hypothetical protein